MSRVVSGTEDFTDGPIEVPTAVDKGKEFSQLVVEFMERMAVHTHTEVSSPQAALPKRTVETFTGITFTEIISGKYSCDITMTQIQTNGAVLSYEYKLATDPDSNESWTRFYPTEERFADLTIVKLYTNRNDIDIRVIG